jgi:hypothetical protein
MQYHRLGAFVSAFFTPDSQVNIPALGKENELVDTVKDDRMPVSEIYHPAMLAEVSHMGNVG